MDSFLRTYNLRNLINSDRKNIFRDPLLLLIFLAPLLLLAVVYIGVPYGSRLLLDMTGFNLSPYFPLILAFMASVPCLLYGILAGFMLLDDKDEKILLQISVTPFGLRRYYIYRIALLSGISLVFSFFFLYFNPLTDLNLFRCLTVSFNICAESAAAALFLAEFAKNKVEGLTLGKSLGVLFLGPAAAFFIPAPYHFIAGIVPPYWNGVLIFTEGPLPLYAACSLVIHSTIIFLLFRIPGKRLAAAG